MGFKNPEELGKGALLKIIVTLHQNLLGYDGRLFFFKFKNDIGKRKKCLAVGCKKIGELLSNPIKEVGVTTQSTQDNAHLRFVILNENKKSIYDRIVNRVLPSRCERFVLEILTHLSRFSFCFKDYQSCHMEDL